MQVLSLCQERFFGIFLFTGKISYVRISNTGVIIMLVLPIVNRDRILNVRIRLKTAHLVRQNVKYEDLVASDIVVHNQSFTQSSYGKQKQTSSTVMDFIRNYNKRNSENFYVSTKEEDHSDLYRIYEVVNPPEKITEGLDCLYGSLILDLKNEIPERERGRYVDFEKLGVVDHITEERLEKLSYIASHVEENYSQAILDNHLEDLIDTLDFLELFDCMVIEKSSISIENFKKVLNSISTTCSKDAKSLNNYYDIALANQEAYSKLSRLYNIVYNDSLKWIYSSKDKVKVKTTFEKKEAA